MLNALDIKSTPVVLNTTSGDDLDPKVPRIYLEHAISCVYLDGKRIYLDSTGYNSRYPSFSVGNQGVWCLNPMDRELQYIPQGSPGSMLAKYYSSIDMNMDGDCKISWWTKYNGEYESYIRSYYKSIKPSRYEEVFKNMISGISPRNELLDFDVKNTEDISKPFSLMKKYNLYEYPSFAADLVIFSLPGFSHNFPELSLKKRKFPIEYQHPFMKEHVFSINIPEGMEIISLPEPLNINNPYFSYQASFRVADDNRIVFTDSYRRRVRYVPVEDYDKYRSQHMLIQKYVKDKLFLRKEAK